MKIRKVLSIVALFALVSFGQADKRDQIKQLKSARIAAALNLSAAESQKFWPLYLNSEEREYEIRHNKIRPVTNKIDEKGIDALSQKEALQYLVTLESAEDEIVTLRKKLIYDLKPVIGTKKILKLRKAEDDFTKLLMSKYSKSKKD
ncbi:sensor of ECF-type sigma factor [Flavobacterium hauense]